MHSIRFIVFAASTPSSAKTASPYVICPLVTQSLTERHVGYFAVIYQRGDELMGYPIQCQPLTSFIMIILFPYPDPLSILTYTTSKVP